MKLLYCIVNYRTDQPLLRYIESLRIAFEQASDIALRLVVVDNSLRPLEGRERFTAELAERFAEIQVVFTDQNVGYFGAVPIAQGLAAATGPDCIVISNADLTVADDFLATLADQLPTGAAVLAPTIAADQGAGFDQNPKLLERYTHSRMRFLQLVYSTSISFRLYNWLGWLKEKTRSPSSRRHQHCPRDIYAPHGAIFIFSKLSFFLALPRHEPFLYGEEIFIAEEARRRAERIAYVPCLKTFDTRHASTGALSTESRRKLMKASVDFILARYYAETTASSR